MAKKHQYFIDRLPPGYTSTFDEAAQKLTFTCDQGHTRTVSSSQCVNRFSICNKALKKDPPEVIHFCADCNKGVRSAHTAQRWDTRCCELGFQFISHDAPTRKVKYICSCGTEKEVTEAALLNPNHQGGCHACSQLKNRKSLADIAETFEKGGCTLLESEYINNKVPLRYRCSCGNESVILLADFNAGKRCANCAGDRTKQTSLVRYGVDNPAKSEEVKERGKQTCMTVYGVPHHSQHPDVQARKEATCRENHGVPTILIKPEIQQKAGDAMELKYGVRHGFQSSEIMERVRQKNRQRYGTDYPLQSPKFWEEYKKKYRDKYGVDFHTQLREWKEKTIPKILRSNFCLKPYIMPSGVKVDIMGYEGRCIDLLLGINKTKKHIPLVSEAQICIYPDPFAYIDENGVERLYYPDMEIIDPNNHTRKITIEVKSIWTFNKEYKRNYRKALKTSIANEYQIWIFGAKTLVDIITFVDGKGKLSSGREYKGGKLLISRDGETKAVEMIWDPEDEDELNEATERIYAMSSELIEDMLSD